MTLLVRYFIFRMSERVFGQGSSELAFFLFCDVASGKPEKPESSLLVSGSLGIHRLVFSIFLDPGSGRIWHLLQTSKASASLWHQAYILTRQFRRGRALVQKSKGASNS